MLEACVRVRLGIVAYGVWLTHKDCELFEFLILNDSRIASLLRTVSFSALSSTLSYACCTANLRSDSVWTKVTP